MMLAQMLRVHGDVDWMHDWIRKGSCRKARK